MVSTVINTDKSLQSDTTIHPLLARSHSSQPSVASLVVIDGHIEHCGLLASSVTDRAICVVLESDRDGIEQITAAFENHQSIDHLYIISHGSSGCLYLGNRELDATTLDSYREQIQRWFFPNQYQATIHLYACNVAADQIGVEFIEKLHALTGANIAASTEPIGCSNWGGSWKLDYQLQPVVEQLPITRAALIAYPDLLASGDC